MSGAQTSTFADPNILLRTLSGDQTAQVQRNQLLNQGAQQALNENEMEQVSRAANWIVSQDPENKDPAKQAAAYGAAVKLLRANNFAMKAPDQYPGFDAMQMMARQGMPSKDLYQQTQDSAWANANKIPSTPAAPGAAAPPADGGTGGFSSDKETARRQILQQETGGEANPATALNYVARADPTALARGATASGKYQFVNSTWREGLQLAGIDPSLYPTARDAPDKVQDQVFDAVYAKYGTKPWEKGPKDWVKDEQGRYQLATVRPPPGSPGGAPVTAAAAPPGGGTTPPPYRVAQAGPLTTPPPGAAPGAAAAPPAPVTTIEPETGLPMLSGPPNQVMPGQPNGPPARPAVPMRETFLRGPDGSVQKAFVPVDGSGPPVIVPPPTAPAATPPAATPPAATPPAATAPPPPPAVPQQPPFSRPAPVNPATGLRPDQEQELNGLLPMASRSREGQAQWVARKQQMIQQNQADQRQYETQVNTWQNQQGEAADRAERIRLSQATGQREQEAAAAAAEQRRIENKRQQEAADRDAQRLAQGSTQADKDTYTLTHNDPSTPEYAEAWTRKKWSQSPNGNVIENDVSEYRAPTRSIQRPSFLPAPTPQGLDEVRKADTDAKVITSAIDHYTDVFAATGGKNWGAYFDNPQSPEAQQLLGAFDRLKTVLRSPVYYNTGVLQPAEMAMLKEDLVSPKTLRGLFATPQALATRLNEIKIAILTRQDAELRSVGKDGVIVRDKADFAKVPEGGRYYDEEGNLRIKPGVK